MIREGKKASAYWAECLGPDGKLRSGKTEDDALRYVLGRCYAETVVVDDDEDEEKDDDDEDNENVNDVLEDNEGKDDDDDEVVQIEDNRIEKEGDISSGNEKAPKSKEEEVVDAPSWYQPPWLLAYMLFGQWGAARFPGITRTSTLFCGDAESMSGKSKVGRKDQRKEQTEDSNNARDNGSNRGIIALHTEELALKKKEMDQKEKLIDLETQSLKHLTDKAARDELRDKYQRNKNIVDALEAKGKEDEIDENGINRYKQAKKRMYDALDELDN